MSRLVFGGLAAALVVAVAGDPALAQAPERPGKLASSLAKARTCEALLKQIDPYAREKAWVLAQQEAKQDPFFRSEKLTAKQARTISANYWNQLVTLKCEAADGEDLRSRFALNDGVRYFKAS